MPDPPAGEANGVGRQSNPTSRSAESAEAPGWQRLIPSLRPGVDAGPAELRPLLEQIAGLLLETAGGTRAWALLRQAPSEPWVSVSVGEPSPAGELDAGDRVACEQALAAGGASDLGAVAISPDLRRLAERHAVSAAAPICDRQGKARGLLLLGGPLDPPGRVRATTLAALEQAATGLVETSSTLAVVARLRHLDQAVRRLDRLATLGDLLAEAVHEMRNPLVSIKTFIQLLPEHANDPEFSTRFRAVVSDELQRLERLLDSLLQHARPGSPSESIDGTAIEAAFESVATLLRLRALERNVTVEFDVDRRVQAVRLPEDALRQVLLNLAQNALEAAPPGSLVQLKAAGLPGHVEILVEDEGRGIPPAARARIFEPFHSTRSDRPGGLGLAITRRIVEEAGGEISVEASASGGARFRIRLPSCRDVKV